MGLWSKVNDVCYAFVMWFIFTWTEIQRKSERESVKHIVKSNDLYKLLFLHHSLSICVIILPAIAVVIDNELILQ